MNPTSCSPHRGASRLAALGTLCCALLFVVLPNPAAAHHDPPCTSPMVRNNQNNMCEASMEATCTANTLTWVQGRNVCVGASSIISVCTGTNEMLDQHNNRCVCTSSTVRVPPFVGINSNNGVCEAAADCEAENNEERDPVSNTCRCTGTTVRVVDPDQGPICVEPVSCILAGEVRDAQTNTCVCGPNRIRINNACPFSRQSACDATSTTFNSATNECDCRSGFQHFPALSPTRTICFAPVTCTGTSQMLNTAFNRCECTGTTVHVPPRQACETQTGAQRCAAPANQVCEEPMTCTGANEMLNMQTNRCDCTGTTERVPPGAAGTCAEPVMCDSGLNEMRNPQNNMCECTGTDVRVPANNNACEMPMMCPPGQPRIEYSNMCGCLDNEILVGEACMTHVEFGQAAARAAGLSGYWNTGEMAMRSAIDQVASAQTAGRLGLADKQLAASDLFSVDGLSGFFSVRYLDGDYDRLGPNRQMDYDGWSAVFGASRNTPINNGGSETIGFALSYQTTEGDIATGGGANRGTLDTDSLGLTFFAERDYADDHYLRFLLHGSFIGHEQDRFTAADPDTLLHADPDGYGVKVRVEGGHRIQVMADPSSTLWFAPFIAFEGTYAYLEGFNETISGIELRVDSIDHSRGSLQLGAEIEWSGQMDNDMTAYLTVRAMGEAGVFGSDTIGVDFLTEDATIRSEIEAFEEQRWSLALTGGTRWQTGSEFAFRYNRDFSDDDDHDNFALRFLFPL